MQENTHCYEWAQVSSPRPTKRRNGLPKTMQKDKVTLRTRVVQWRCGVELLAVNLVRHLPRPLGASLRKLVYPLFFAHTGEGLHARANQSNTSQTSKTRSLYENCLRGYL